MAAYAAMTRSRKDLPAKARKSFLSLTLCDCPVLKERGGGKPNGSANWLDGIKRQGGFSLIETIVALALFAGVFVIFNQGLTTNWQGVGRADRSASAVALATALLASAGVETPLVDGARTAGQQDGFSWELSVDKYREPDSDGAKEFLARDATRNVAGQVAAYWVGIDVSWLSGPLQKPRSVKLRTLKLGRS
jgi:prepilin-type N-terminal cleavage/methylation domain-containing protein